LTFDRAPVYRAAARPEDRIPVDPQPDPLPTAEAYVVFTPGEAIERFVRAAAALAPDAGPDDVVAVAQRHGVTFAGPVPR
jgi:hypothetical protein